MKNTSYVSEATEFLNSMLKNPEIHHTQMELRRTWWHNDNNDDAGFIDLAAQEEYAEGRKHDAYSYFSYPTKK